MLDHIGIMVYYAKSKAFFERARGLQDAHARWNSAAPPDLVRLASRTSGSHKGKRENRRCTSPSWLLIVQ